MLRWVVAWILVDAAEVLMALAVSVLVAVFVVAAMKANGFPVPVLPWFGSLVP